MASVSDYSVPHPWQRQKMVRRQTRGANRADGGLGVSQAGAAQTVSKKTGQYPPSNWVGHHFSIHAPIRKDRLFDIHIIFSYIH